MIERMLHMHSLADYGKTMNNFGNMTEDKSLFSKVIDTISGIFIPMLNVLMAAALIKGFLFLFKNLGFISETDGVYQILYALSNGFFYFLPVFLAYTASKKLKADPFTSILIACTMLYPDITKVFEKGTGLDFLGLPVQSVTYPSSVIPIILAVWLLHYVELPLEKYLPKAVKGFLKPMIALLIVVPATFLVFGPVGALIGNILADAYSALYGLSPALAGAVFGFIWQPMVVFGVQWGMIPVIIQHISVNGIDTILPLLGPAVMGQAGAAMAVSLLSKNKNRKALAFSCGVTAILGVTEPALYGVNVPLKRPMLAACIAGAIGGAIVGNAHAGAVSFAFPSILTLVVYLGKGFWTFFICLLLDFVLGFVLTMLFGIKEPDINEEKAVVEIEN